MKAVEMAGIRYGQLTAIRPAGRCKSRDIKWEFSCDCGVLFEASGYAARIGKIVSCPECAKKRVAKSFTTHGRTKTVEYSVWTDIQTRCHNERSTSYANYGGRGIAVCIEWRESFERFLSDMGARPSPAHSIERENNNLGYQPGNCRWATIAEQSNNKRTNINVEIDGITKTLAQWAQEKGLNYHAVRARYQKGARGAAIFVSARQLLTHNGITDSVAGWSRRTGIKTSTIHMRIGQYKWSVSRALSEGAKL